MFSCQGSKDILKSVKRSLNKETFNDICIKKYKLTLTNKNSSIRSQQTCKINICFSIIIFQFLFLSFPYRLDCVNLCKFVASFPRVFAVSCTPDLLQKFRKKSAVYMFVFTVFSPCFELCITMYLRKFTLPRILSRDKITCFLGHWLGNFSTKSLNQIRGLLSLNTFQDLHNNKCQSIQTVFHSLKIKLSHACMIQDVQT